MKKNERSSEVAEVEPAPEVAEVAEVEPAPEVAEVAEVAVKPQVYEVRFGRELFARKVARFWCGGRFLPPGPVLIARVPAEVLNSPHLLANPVEDPRGNVLFFDELPTVPK